MSALYRNAKQKVTQSELRKFMNEHKNKNKTVKKIDSPLAKYTESGQLMCILCQSVVRSETVWPVHINAKQHKENVQKAKQLKDELQNGTSSKRPLTPDPNEPQKKIKGILKNSSTSSKTNELPNNFFDSTSKLSQSKSEVKILPDNVQDVKNEPMEVEGSDKFDSSEVLPEGFFDDPKLDAKARHLEYKDPVEEEWEKFQKEIKEVDHKSAEIIAEDQEEATTERQIDEIDEQMRNWSRVLDWEKKKNEVIIPLKKESNVEDDSMSEDENFDEFLDWRSKRSFK